MLATPPCSSCRRAGRSRSPGRDECSRRADRPRSHYRAGLSSQGDVDEISDSSIALAAALGGLDIALRDEHESPPGWIWKRSGVASSTGSPSMPANTTSDRDRTSNSVAVNSCQKLAWSAVSGDHSELTTIEVTTHCTLAAVPCMVYALFETSTAIARVDLLAVGGDELQVERLGLRAEQLRKEVRRRLELRVAVGPLLDDRRRTRRGRRCSRTSVH